jgi:hypothetical protein
VTTPQPPPGVPYVDPTENVKTLVEADRRRQDDLREMQARHVVELMSAETRRMDEKAEMRAEHAKETRVIETARVDAIRLVDVGAQNRAAEVQAATQAALAAQLVATAEASRSQVAASATAFAQSLAAELEPMKKDIRDVRDRQSQDAGGKQQVVETRDVRAENRLSINTVVVVIGALISVLLLYATFHGH